MKTIEKQYLALLEDILENGVVKDDRTGTGTKSVFGRTLRHNMKDGFPLLTTKRLSFHNIKHELLWFLQGDTNIRYLLENNVHIWSADAYRRYMEVERKIQKRLEIENPAIDFSFEYLSLQEFETKIVENDSFADKWGDLGPTYGQQWRNWYTEGHGTDQIGTLINQIRLTPDSRRLIVTAWNPAEIEAVVLPPCHHMFQCWTRELTLQERVDHVLNHMVSLTQEPEWEEWDFENQCPEGFEISRHKYIESLDWWDVPTRAISLQWNQRSVDTFLGLPYNLASYGLLLQMIADEVNMVAEELIGVLADTHIYLNHIEQVEEQMRREPYGLPRLVRTKGIESVASDLRVIGYARHEAIKAPLSVG